VAADGSRGCTGFLVKPRAAISWSGGKDCCTALLRTHRAYDVVAMVTMFAEDGARSRSHGLRPEVIAAHAERLGIRNLTGHCSWSSYTDEYIRLLGDASAMGITHIIFGDIIGDAHRAWDERVCAAHGLTAVLPLWGESTRALVEEFIASGSAAVIVTARAAHLDASWLGRSITLDCVRELEALGIDPCGEFGEYHTVVTGTPLFSAPLELSLGVREMHSECWALDVTLSAPGAYIGAGIPGSPPASAKPVGGGGKPRSGEGGNRPTTDDVAR
jgi:diphthine-ammonia ligase